MATKQNMAAPSLVALEDEYVDRANELRSRQLELGNMTAELYAFMDAQDALRSHPDFFGTLPKTFYSGSHLDPDGLIE